MTAPLDRMDDMAKRVMSLYNSRHPTCPASKPPRRASVRRGRRPEKKLDFKYFTGVGKSQYVKEYRRTYNWRLLRIIRDALAPVLNPPNLYVVLRGGDDFAEFGNFGEARRFFNRMRRGYKRCA